MPGRHSTLLPPTSLEVGRDDLLLVQGDNQAARTALALVLTGRMKPRTGRVSWDGRTGLRDVRHASALVDAPGVNEPDAFVRVKDLVTEDLALIPRMTRDRLQPMRWLAGYHQDDIADTFVEALTPTDRLDLMVNLALADPDVHLVVCDTPERHGARDEHWLNRLGEIVADHERGVAVVAIVSSIPDAWTGPALAIGDAAAPEAPSEHPASEQPAAEHPASEHPEEHPADDTAGDQGDPS